MKKGLRPTMKAPLATGSDLKAADPRVADLVRAGILRVALHSTQHIKDPVTGEIRRHGPGTVSVQIAQALAARLGIEFQLVGYPTPPAVVESLKASACDLGFLGFNPSRATDVAFAPPHWVVPFTYMVPAASSIRCVTDADRPGVRIAVVRNHEATMALSRIVKHAELVGAEIPDAAFDLLITGHADAFASNFAVLLTYSPKLSGSRILEDHYGTNLGAMAVSRDQPGLLAYVSEFIEEAKASGLVQRAIERADQRGLRVAPPGNPTGQD